MPGPSSVRAVLVTALLIVVGVAQVTAAAAGPPAVQWQRCLGGTDLPWAWVDEASAVQQTADGGCVVAGSTQSTDGDVAGNHGGTDAWVVKLDPAGGIEWQRCLGGTGTDWATDVQQTADGGYIVAGSTASTDGDVTGVHGGFDAWMVKLSPAGGIQWQRCLGGTGADHANAVAQAGDGGYILAGSTASSDGDVVGYHGPHPYGSFYPDLWVVKLDPGGAPAWQSRLGGSDGEVALDVRQTADGGYVVAGVASSADGEIGVDFPGSYVDTDAVVVKLDAGGTPEWHASLGGAEDDAANSVDQTPDGGYIVAGTVRSLWGSGDVYGNHGNADAWVVKLNATGWFVWQRSLGGTSSDSADEVRRTADGGYIVGGRTASTDGDVTGFHGGGGDAWVVKLNATGGLAWQRCLGGTNDDSAGALQPTTDGGYIVAGKTSLERRRRLRPPRPPVRVRRRMGREAGCRDLRGDGSRRRRVADGHRRRRGVRRRQRQRPEGLRGRRPLLQPDDLDRRRTSRSALFDYNGNGRIDFADVVWLFNDL